MIMKRAIFTAVVLIFSIILSGTVFADGIISNLAYSPQEVFALSDTKMEIGVENNGDKSQDYKLVVSVITEGLVESEQKFSFGLIPGEKKKFSSEFVPRSIGYYQIIARLYDENEIDLYDTEVASFNSLSEIGPFDLNIEIPTKIVRPNSRVPVVINLENKGVKSTDVELQVKLNCAKTLKETFYELAEAGSQIEEIFSFQSCPTTGVYEVVADVMLFNKTWISSSSQLIIDNYITELSFQPPMEIYAESGKSSLFMVEVDNIGDKEIDSLKLIVTRIPSDWIQVSPPETRNLRPKGEAIFVVNITIPPFTKNRDINFTFIATAVDTQVEQRSVMKISGMASAAPNKDASNPFVFALPKLDVPNFQSIFFEGFYIFAFSTIGISIAVGGAILAIRKNWRNERNQHIAYKIYKIKKMVADRK